MGHDRPETNDENCDSAPIWRYMDLPKFVAMLTSNTVWFAKAARLEDCYEGFCEAVAREMPAHDPSAECIRRTISEGGTTVISPSQLFVLLSERAAEYFQNAREHLYVNSWCLADESMAMWEIYGSEGRGIAVSSSTGRYVQAARFDVREEQCSFGKVEYLGNPHSNSALRFDLSEGPIPLPGLGLWEKLLPVAFHKRTCFEHEREWRAAMCRDERSDCHGCSVSFNLHELIDAVYVGPRADPLFFDVVASVMEKFGLNKPLRQSALLRQPAQRSTFPSGHRPAP